MPARSPLAPVGLELRLDPAPSAPLTWRIERTVDGENEPYLRVAGTPERYWLRHTRGLELEVAGSRILVRHLAPDLAPDDVEHLLLDQLLPLVIARLGRLSLHGSAVAWDGSAVVFVANSGVGKSTTAAAAVTRAGATFVADDQVALEPRDERFLVHASYPSVRLLDDAAEQLFGASPVDGRKARVALPTITEPASAVAIVVLVRGPTFGLEAIRPRDALVSIAPHVDRLDPTDRATLREELERLTQLVQTTQTMRATIPAHLSDLDERLHAFRALAIAGRP